MNFAIEGLCVMAMVRGYFNPVRHSMKVLFALGITIIFYFFHFEREALEEKWVSLLNFFIYSHVTEESDVFGLKSIYATFIKPFVYGVLSSNLLSFLSNPNINTLIKKRNSSIKFGLFLGLLSYLNVASEKLFRDKIEVSKHKKKLRLLLHFVIGFIVSLFNDSTDITLYFISNSLYSLFNILRKRLNIPTSKYEDNILYGLAISPVLYAMVFEPKTVRPGIKNFIHKATSNIVAHFEDINFGTVYNIPQKPSNWRF